LSIGLCVRGHPFGASPHLLTTLQHRGSQTAIEA
jgi:hypothetical protein